MKGYTWEVKAVFRVSANFNVKGPFARAASLRSERVTNAFCYARHLARDLKLRKPWIWLEMTDPLCIASFNGPSCAGYPSSGAGACRHTAAVFCIPASNYLFQRRRRGRDAAAFNTPRSAILRCLFIPEGSIYHKAASRWLGKLHRNVSGTHGWINFCALQNKWWLIHSLKWFRTSPGWFPQSVNGTTAHSDATVSGFLSEYRWNTWKYQHVAPDSLLPNCNISHFQ